MRDYVPPVNLMCELIPRHVLEDKYGMMITKPIEGEDKNRAPHAEELLLAHACMHPVLIFLYTCKFITIFLLPYRFLFRFFFITFEKTLYWS